jgi:hypothetical protein
MQWNVFPQAHSPEYFSSSPQLQLPASILIDWLFPSFHVEWSDISPCIASQKNLPDKLYLYQQGMDIFVSR